MLDRLVAEKIEAVQTIRDEFTKHVQDAPVNLNYLVTKENFCPDWKKLKSTQFKMDVLEVTESDINMHVISYKTEGKNNDSIEFLLQLDFKRKQMQEKAQKQTQMKHSLLKKRAAQKPFESKDSEEEVESVDEDATYPDIIKVDFSKPNDKLQSYLDIRDFNLLQKNTSHYAHSSFGANRPGQISRSARKTSAISRASVSNNKQLTQNDIDDMLDGPGEDGSTFRRMKN